MQFRYLWLIAFSIFLCSCGGGNNKFTVIGSIKNLPKGTILLEEINMDALVTVDSATADESGNFELTGTTIEPHLYRLNFGEGRFILLSLDKGNVKVNADWNTIENYEVVGSASSESLKKLLMVIRGHMRDLSKMEVVLDSLKASNDTAKLVSARASIKEMNVSLTRYLEQYADTTLYLPNAIFAAQIINPQAEKQFIESFIQSLPTRFKDAKLAKEFTDKYNEMVTAMNQQQAPPEASGKAPEISLQTPDGETVTLSSMRGKYILVDFWASWCGPCRQENPNVVRAYNSFKNKNFTILGVSLDEDKDKWLQAIKKDGLTWTHVSDLKGWQSLAARDYNVNAIPANFLIDPDGNIIASNLRGDDLTAKLQEVLGN